MSIFEEFYEETFDSVYKYVFSRTGQQDISEDIVSTAFLKLLTRYSHIKDKGRLKALLFAIARNCMMDYFNKVKKIEPLENDPLTDLAGEDEEEELLSSALQKLSDEEKELISFKYFSGLTFREIGLILNTNEKTVQSRIYKILEKLREEVNNGY